MAIEGPHKRTIDELLASDPDIAKHGFWTAVRKLIRQIPTADPEDFGNRTFVPDAYKIDSLSKKIITYEVEYSNKISPSKLDVLIEFWMDWDADEYDDWTFEVFVKDCFGTPPRRLNMIDLYYEYIDRQIARGAAADNQAQGTSQ